MGNATSPASSGPAGSHFEGQVGANYLLSVLTGAEPRGLPGTIIDRVEMQRASEGRPLDDVIVQARDGHGEHAVLEIQVKRRVTFTPSDPIFRAVVGQIVEASRRSDFWTTRYELAIAIARTSHKIDGAYQDVLTWARQVGAAATFMAAIERPGSANDDMRTFVHTFRSHLNAAGSPDDDETVWKLLRKLQILVFDFTAQGSASEALAKERAVRALHPDEATRAGALWENLVELALEIAASGGDRTREALIDDLRPRSFRLAGEHRYSLARAALAEGSRNALADIVDHVGGVMLTRHNRVSAVHEALDEGRYIEIRGDAGVGKSGVLKHFAEQIAVEAQMIVLSPGRTTPRGWIAMRAEIGFDGTAFQLLLDLAADDAAVLFLDGLDMFGEEERSTVVDLVREAANVPCFTIIATARRNFGVEEPNWLPAYVLDRLGRTAPVVIDELNQAEVDELRQGDPRLAALLAESHPAREVTRNLFRLALLANQLPDEPVPVTEIDMAEHWWRTADGRYDDDHRERARLLKALAEQALSRAEPLDVSDRPTRAVNALVASETLRDLEGDRVAFRHDVLRDWAVANLITSEPAMIDRLILNRPAPPSLARGVELAARIAVERASDGERWQSLLELFSRDGAHGSWRRATLLAIVRSESGITLLTRVSDLLLADRGSLLRELIRTVMAVDVQPASVVFAGVGADPAAIPAGLNVPCGPSWHRLIYGLLALGERLPQAAIPEVADLYTTWSGGMIGQDPLTPLLLPWLYRWLMEIEKTSEPANVRELRVPFGGELDHDQIGPLERELRSGFLLFCDRTPELAAQYLGWVQQRRHRDDVLRSIFKFRGALARAAPAELAELTATALLKKPEREGKDRDRRRHHQPFGSIDHAFMPASPAQGPFLELLTHAPEHGLSLVRQLVDQSVLFYSGGKPHESDVIIVPFSDGDRPFPWVQSYTWSREGTHHNCVTSALMALEAWAHSRIEAGVPFETVLADVLGPSGSPAAYLLVAVDIVLSHWPKSRGAAIPFLTCPELLCLDRERRLIDNFEYPDIFVLKASQKEPVGMASLDSLKKRPSRHHELENLLSQYAIYGPTALRKTLMVRLRRAAERLGPPDQQSSLRDPAFMVVYALNLLDPNNWREAPVERPDGTQTTAWQYLPPKAESEHLQALRDASADRFSDTNMQSTLGIALEDRSRSSPELAKAAAAWARRANESPSEDGDDDQSMREQAIITAAMITMRDGDESLREQHQGWARSVFNRAFQSKDDFVYQIRAGVRFNPVAIAFVGMVHLLKWRCAAEDLRTIFQIATRADTAATHGFGVTADVLATIDERFVRAVLRCGLAACIRPGSEWGLSEEEVAARSERHRQRVGAAVDAELAWIYGGGTEPEWPAFPSTPARPRPGIRLPGKPEQEGVSLEPDSRVDEDYVDRQGAAIWISNARSLYDESNRHWLIDIVRTYSSWTAEANGAGLRCGETLDRPPREWNDAYFNLVAFCVTGLEVTEVDQLALTPICSLPDEPFFDLVEPFLRGLDAVYFNDRGIQEAEAVRIRSVLAHRLMSSPRWTHLAGSRSTSIEIHIGPAIGVFFFNEHGLVQPTTCYLLPKGIDRLDGFLPVLEELVRTGTCLFVALVTLNLFEVSPRPAHFPFIVTAAKAWQESHAGDRSFWVEHEIGSRVCELIDRLRPQNEELFDPEHPIRREIDVLLSDLIGVGVAEAARLEAILVGR